MPIGGPHTHKNPTTTIQLSGNGGAIKGVLRHGNGGTGNERGLAAGLVMERSVSGSTLIPYGSVLVMFNGRLVESTLPADVAVVGVVAELDGIGPNGSGLVQVSGLAEVRVTGTVYAGDRLVTSATQGVAVASNSGVAQFGYAMSHSYGDDMVQALLTPASLGGISSAFDHGGLGGLGDNDHVQYLLRSQLAQSANKIGGAVPTGYEEGGTASWWDLDHATDGDPETVVGVSTGITTASHVGLRFDFGTPMTLSLWKAWVSPKHYVSGWRVRISDDGATWTTLDSGPLPIDLAYGTPDCIITQAHRQATARYWEWALLNGNGSYSYLPEIGELEWYEAASEAHALFSDMHADVDISTEPADGQVLAWDDAAGLWAPASASYGSNSVSFGSNSNEVSGANAPGASPAASHADHVHLGVTSLTHASNTLSGPLTFQTAGSLGIVLTAPNTLLLTAGSGEGGGGAVAYGSNSNAVGDANAPGATEAVSRADHVHLGYREVTASASNTLFPSVLNLRAGANVALGVNAANDTITISATGPTGGGGSAFVVELPYTTTWTVDRPNGIFNALGMQGGNFVNPGGGAAGLWLNDPSASSVAPTQSTDQDSNRTAMKALDHSLDENYGCTHTQGIANSWWKVDFKTGRTFTPTRLAIVGRASGGQHPRNFKLRGSNNNTDWTDLLTVTAAGPADNAWWSSAVTGAGAYRYLEIYQTGLNSSSADYLVLGEVEMWGTLEEVA